jgi:amino acid transporter
MLIQSREGSHSAFIVACVRSHTTVLPHLINAFFIFSAFSCGVNGLYTASRLLHALASVRNAWPTRLYWLKSRLERTTSKGVPLAAVVTSWLFGFLGFLGANPQPSKILGRLAILSSACMMVVFMFVSIAFLFYISCTVEAEPNDPVSMDGDQGPLLNRAAANYPYRSHLQWARAAFAGFACFLILFFNGFKSLLSPFDAEDFVASYVAIPIFCLLATLYHIKDERTYNPFRFTRRATMNISGPMETMQTDPLKRRGRLHRANMQRFWVHENLIVLKDFIWVWLK